LLNNLKVIALLLAVSLLSGCSGTTGSGNSEVGMQSKAPPTNTTSAPTTESENPSPIASDTVRIARWARERNWPSMTALNVTKLGIVNNCLVLTHETGSSIKASSSTLPIFPYYDGVWDEAKRTFTYEGKVIRIGETIRVGGGTITDIDDFLKRAGVKYYVPDCGITNFWVAP
jgi:hypothetical protein